jgi:hypothetical protein
LAWLAVVIGLPVAAHAVRSTRPPGCALDGMAIDPAYRVEVEGADGGWYTFCCVRCAGLWVGRQTSPPRSIAVTDEATGERIDAASAWYVRSTVVTSRTSGNRVHVFRTRADAEAHAERFAGIVLPTSDRPFP